MKVYLYLQLGLGDYCACLFVSKVTLVNSHERHRLIMVIHV